MTGFSTPTGIAVDSHGHVFVADDGSRLRELSSRGKLLKMWGGAGAAPGQLDDPNFVALDGQGNLYVSDTRNDRIQKLSADGGLAAWGETGTGLGSLNHPLGIAVGGVRVYVADTFDNRVVVFSLSGRPLAQWGAGVLHHPAGLALDKRGDLFVADAGNNLVRKFTRDGQLTSWGTNLHVHRPTGLTIDHMGNLYVAVRQDNKVAKVSSAGRLLALWGRGGTGPAQFGFRSQSAMNGLAVGHSGNIWVADTGNNRIKKLAPTGQVLSIWS